MSDSRERDDKRFADEPNEAGFAGGATTPQVEHDDRTAQEAERIAVPGDDLTSALTAAVNRDKSDENE